MLKILLRFVPLILLPALACAAEFQVDLGSRDPLILDLPQGWQARVARPSPGLPPTVTIATSNSKAIQVLVTPIWPSNGAASPTRDQIRALVQGAAEQVKRQAVEASLPLVELMASDKAGYYFAATDRAPEPDGFKHLTQGAVGMGDLRITFTILINGEPEKLRSQALEMLRGMRRAKPGRAI